MRLKKIEMCFAHILTHHDEHGHYVLQTCTKNIKGKIKKKKVSL